MEFRIENKPDSKSVSLTDFKRMSYKERLELYNSDRSLYDSLVAQMNPEPPKPIQGVPWDYDKSGTIIRKE